MGLHCWAISDDGTQSTYVTNAAKYWAHWVATVRIRRRMASISNSCAHFVIKDLELSHYSIITSSSTPKNAISRATFAVKSSFISGHFVCTSNGTRIHDHTSAWCAIKRTNTFPIWRFIVDRTQVNCQKLVNSAINVSPAHRNWKFIWSNIQAFILIHVNCVAAAIWSATSKSTIKSFPRAQRGWFSFKSNSIFRLAEHMLSAHGDNTMLANKPKCEYKMMVRPESL